MPEKRTISASYIHARQLRKESTPAEARLWAYLRNKQMAGSVFRRQHPIGPYVVDFCCIKKQLVIELDGSQHLDQADYDTERSEFLKEQGYRVIRFWNNTVMNDINWVIRTIEQALGD